MSGESTFKIELKRAQQQWALLSLDGRPLSNCNILKVTDLEPSSLLGRIDYPIPQLTNQARLRLNNWCRRENTQSWLRPPMARAISSSSGFLA